MKCERCEGKMIYLGADKYSCEDCAFTLRKDIKEIIGEVVEVIENGLKTQGKCLKCEKGQTYTVNFPVTGLETKSNLPRSEVRCTYCSVR
jgi:hypothetical protein